MEEAALPHFFERERDLEIRRKTSPCSRLCAFRKTPELLIARLDRGFAPPSAKRVAVAPKRASRETEPDAPPRAPSDAQDAQADAAQDDVTEAVPNNARADADEDASADASVSVSAADARREPASEPVTGEVVAVAVLEEEVQEDAELVRLFFLDLEELTAQVLLERGVR